MGPGANAKDLASRALDHDQRSDVNAHGLASGQDWVGLSVVICIVAALNLFIDFAVTDQGVANGAPSFMEWHSALGPRRDRCRWRPPA
jgi:Bax inhibitor 1 like